jgi:hypothetical protein
MFLVHLTLIMEEVELTSSVIRVVAILVCQHVCRIVSCIDTKKII